MSLAFDLTGVYALDHISGGHFNPAVSVGLWSGGRFDAKHLIPYIISQVIGASLAKLVLYLIIQVQAGFSGTAGFSSNGFAELSPRHYFMTSALIIEIVLTGFFLIVIMGSTDQRALAAFAPMAVGLALTLIHLISIPVTNRSLS